MNPALVFNGMSGINTVVDPDQLKVEADTGIAELAAAVNITIGQSHEGSLRPGSTLVEAGDFHSLFCDGGECLTARGTSLFLVGTDLSIRGLRSGMSGDRIGYAQGADRIFYANGTDNGMVVDGVSYPWPFKEYVGPRTNRHFSPAPAVRHLSWAFGRIFIAEGSTVWWSEYLNPYLFNLAKCFWMLPTTVLMIKRVGGGMFVSDEKRTWFYRGANPNKVDEIVKVADFPAYEWSEAIDYVEGADIGIDIPGQCAMWASPEGAILGTPTGQIINMNKNKVIYPETCRQGAGLLMGYNYIHTIY